MNTVVAITIPLAQKRNLALLSIWKPCSFVPFYSSAIPPNREANAYNYVMVQYC